MPRSAEEKARLQALSADLTALTAGFCQAHLDAEHADLAAALIAKMARKRDVPFLRGAPALWAATVIYALAQINFLFDRDRPVHNAPGEIATFFGVNANTVAGKAKALRTQLKLRQFDAEFGNAEMRAAGQRLRNLSVLTGPGVSWQQTDDADPAE